VVAELLHEHGWKDGDTNMTKLMEAFSNLAYAPINVTHTNTCRNGIKPGPIHVRFAVNKVTLEQSAFRILRYYSVSSTNAP